MANMGGPKAHRSGQKAHQTPPEGLEPEGGVAPSNSSHIYDNIGVPSFKTLTGSLIVCLCQMNQELDETDEAPGVPINNSKLATLIGLPQVAPLKLKVTKRDGHTHTRERTQLKFIIEVSFFWCPSVCLFVDSQCWRMHVLACVNACLSVMCDYRGQNFGHVAQGPTDMNQYIPLIS